MIIIESFVAAWALTRVCEIESTNIFGIFAFLFFYYLFHKLMETRKDGCEGILQRRVGIVLSAVFTFFYMCGAMEQIYGELTNPLFKAVVITVTAIGLFLIFRGAVQIVFICTEKWNASGGAIQRKYGFLLVGAVCLVCWLPYLLKNFPGVMTIDSMNQFAQVIGIYAPSNHHPWTHTLVMKFFYEAGYMLTGDRTLAIAFYTVFQMVFMAICVAYLVHTLVKIGIRKKVLIAVTAFYALVPYNALYAVTVWKDSMFAGGVLLYVCTLLRFLQWKDTEVSWGSLRSEQFCDMVMLVVSGFLMSVFRTNGWYAFLITLPFVVLILRKHWKLVLSMQVLVVLAVLVMKGPVMDAQHVIQPDLIESLSIPAQQISRVIVQNKPVTEEQDAFLNHILDTSKIKDLYNPYVSDGFKRLVRAGDETYLEEHFTEFLKVYVQIGLEYPMDYLIAFRDQSIGYWFPTQSGIIAGDEGVIPNEFGVENRSLLKGPVVVKINEIALKLKDILPGYGNLWCMGALFWLILLAGGILLVRGDRRQLLLYIPCIAIFLTLVAATPVAKEFRYAYAYIYCVPLYLVLPFMKEQK